MVLSTLPKCAASYRITYDPSSHVPLSVLRRAQVDARQYLPSFRARPGLSHWHVYDDSAAVRAASKRPKPADAPASTTTAAAGADAAAIPLATSAAGSTGSSADTEGANTISAEVASASTVPDVSDASGERKDTSVHSPEVAACINLG